MAADLFTQMRSMMKLQGMFVKIRKGKGQLLKVEHSKMRGELEASRDYLFKATNIPQDLFRT
jgi:hypothetical protein